MEPGKTSRAGAFFGILERVVLFSLSAAVGVINLLIGVAVAAHLGVLPKETSARILKLSARATSALTRVMAGPSRPSRKKKP
jgi:hypothetical protein